jgi:hypothetical protein
MKSSILISAFLLMIPFAQAAEKHPWASFKPGSYAKMKSTTTVGANKTVTEMTQTLISLDAKTAVVETETKVMGQSMKNRINIPLQAAASPTNAPAAKAPVALNETITVGGKAIACKCYEMESDANGMKTTSRACSSEIVPGGAVRVVSKSSGAVKMDSISELIEFSAK